MNKIYLLLFFIIFSCGYPDIDSVPDFKDMVITREEAIDLCKLANTDNKSISKCLDNIQDN